MPSLRLESPNRGLWPHIAGHHRRQRRRRHRRGDCPRRRLVEPLPPLPPTPTSEIGDRVLSPGAARHRRDGGAGKSVPRRRPGPAPASRRTVEGRACGGGWRESVRGAACRADGPPEPGPGRGAGRRECGRDEEGECGLREWRDRETASRVGPVLALLCTYMSKLWWDTEERMAKENGVQH